MHISIAYYSFHYPERDEWFRNGNPMKADPYLNGTVTASPHGDRMGFNRPTVNENESDYSRLTFQLVSCCYPAISLLLVDRIEF
ncbi:hypothetical protein NPIL_562401 [Nephila pilipes]|uniref:Uncharacterized protein n=1 Tax=Nephila pilipes TaxID=299642 RepID=A0A8X6TJ24_NEPPI|nr:hypothetical protein NPIL_562401 [Nephila pilipes]